MSEIQEPSEAEVDKLLTVNAALVGALNAAREYFDNRADADCDQDGFIPNAEMRLVSEIDAALSQFKQVARAALRVAARIRKDQENG